MANIASKIEEMMDEPCYLIDIFPYTVPKTPDGRYFAVEEYFQQNRREWNEKFGRLLLKLYCYYDFWVSSGEESAENPQPDLLAQWIGRCLEGRRGLLHIVLPQCNSMIVLSGDDLYMSLYHPDPRLKGLIAQLAGAEGLFFYPAPETPGRMESEKPRCF